MNLKKSSEDKMYALISCVLITIVMMTIVISTAVSSMHSSSLFHERELKKLKCKESDSK